MTRLRTLFPDREFIMRSQGQVRFVTLSSKIQIAAVAVVAALLCAWLAAMAAMAWSQWSAEHHRMALAGREAKVAKAEKSVRKYRSGLDTTISDLSRRQQFIQQMVEAHIGDLPAASGDAAKTDAADAKDDAPVRKISAVMPEAQQLARLQADQLAFVDRLTRYADDKSQAAIAAIRKLGINPNAMLASGGAAEGGPLMRLATDADGSLDPRFQRLGVSLARMDALESGLESLPQVSPAHVAYVSSSYGYRSDPFTGQPAFHAGLDFPGPLGSPIYAAAKGTVSFVGQKSGYGNCIEIDHGNGLMTRYGHLSRFSAHVGEAVDAGTVIAAMGSTGRSTGSHLHFEVRINGQPVNPRPFLEAARNVQQQAG